MVIKINRGAEPDTNSLIVGEKNNTRAGQKLGVAFLFSISILSPFWGNQVRTGEI